jgi:hypothetical protein
MNKCPASLIPREMQIKITTPPKCWHITSIGENVRQPEKSSIAGGRINL